MPDPAATAQLLDDGLTLVIRRRVPAGALTATYHRTPGAGPFTRTDVAGLLAAPPSATMRPGQRNTARRYVTRTGTWWVHVMTGPPTWWAPRLKREKDGTIMTGWFRRAIAVKWDPPGTRGRA